MDDPLTFNEPFDPAFGFQKQGKQMAILNLPTDQLQGKWIRVVREATYVRGQLGEETEKAQRWRVSWMCCRSWAGSRSLTISSTYNHSLRISSAHSTMSRSSEDSSAR